MNTWAEANLFLSQQLRDYEETIKAKDQYIRILKNKISVQEQRIDEVAAYCAKSEERVKQLETEQDELIRKNEELRDEIKSLKQRRGGFANEN